LNDKPLIIDTWHNVSAPEMPPLSHPPWQFKPTENSWLLIHLFVASKYIQFVFFIGFLKHGLFPSEKLTLQKNF
jgi:hypothetical protein